MWDDQVIFLHWINVVIHFLRLSHLCFSRLNFSWSPFTFTLLYFELIFHLAFLYLCSCAKWPIVLTLTTLGVTDTSLAKWFLMPSPFSISQSCLIFLALVRTYLWNHWLWSSHGRKTWSPFYCPYCLLIYSGFVFSVSLHPIFTFYIFP